ncbi:hypothetical protein AG1IA_05990 [Rhizoctonia solani AG-1 IA]|uniref:Uncharacterized protein n=1 Tax=Thanatephorus cucumeris (strain AG1-IA) TaxID=983506 RepID=L8WT98_THACA|nr:hypothetical protein AG1IA_05990 [Rhizoctonia solani AG-1 IA]
MCMGESEAPTGFLIIDCPNKDYIPILFTTAPDRVF